MLDRADIEPVSDFDYYTNTHGRHYTAGASIRHLPVRRATFVLRPIGPWENGGLAYSKTKYEMVEAEYAAAVRNQDIEANVQHVKELLALL